ncbi:hypothetical protein [Caballeronia sp. LZ043]|nr:hypothetical protein [Caballeronia sp. LZ043]MDR5821962.1 hypothetical protein [Caballeronia sp. LZ043]
MLSICVGLLICGAMAYLLVRGADERLIDIEQRKNSIHWPAGN